MATKNYYAVLGISRDASPQTLKRAFRKLALQYHPDRNEDAAAAERFSAIHEAYEVLSNEESRRRYDETIGNTYQFTEQEINPRKQRRYDPDLIYLSISKRYVKVDEPFVASVKIFDFNKNFKLEGLEQFEIVNSYYHEVFIQGELLKSANYVLKARSEGRMTLGPAIMTSYGVEYISNQSKLRVSGKFKPLNQRWVDQLMAGTAAFFFILLIGIVGYNVIRYGSEIKPDFPKLESTFAIDDSEEYVRLETGDHPFDSYFGKGLYDPGSENYLLLRTGSETDVVVFLNDLETDKTIRNTYIRANEEYYLTDIPTGTYYLNVIFGNDWAENKSPEGPPIPGIFLQDLQIIKFTGSGEIIQMNPNIKMDDVPYSSAYDITLYPVIDGDAESTYTTAKDFFNL